MANPIVDVVITGQGAGITGDSFTTPAFISPTAYTSTNSLTGTSAEDIAEIYGTESEEYKAALAFFAPTPSVRSVKFIKQECDIDVQATDTTVGLSFYANVTGNPLQVSDLVTVSGTGVDADAAAADLAANLDADPVLGALFNTTVSTDTVTLTPTGATGLYQLLPPVDTLPNPATNNGTENVAISFTSTQTPSAALTAAINEKDDFFFVTTSSRDATELSSLVTVCQAAKKMMGVALTSSEFTAFNSAVGSATGRDYLVVVSQPTSKSYFECALFGYNGLYPSGSVTYNNLQVPGAEKSDWVPSEGFSAVTVIDVGGILVTQNGKTYGGENIEAVRGEADLTNSLEVAFTNLLINQQGTKLGYNNGSIAKLYGINQRILDQFVRQNFIKDNYKINYLPADRVPVADKEAGIYQSGTFTAEYVGAITRLSIRGRLVLDINQA